MNFKLEHTFDAPVEAVLEAMADPAFPLFLKGRMKSMQSIEPVDRKDEGSAVEWKWHCVPTPIIKSVGPKKIAPESLAFTQQTRLDRKARKATFKNVADHPKVRAHLENGGTIEFREENGKTRRTLSGELKVGGLPFLLRPLAGVAEGIIYSNAQKLLQEEAEAFQQFLKERQAARAKTA